MKKIYLLALGLAASIGSYAQTTPTEGNVGIGTKNPDNSAVLDLQSSNKGLLIPRMSVEQRNAIKSPANGLIVYQTNEKTGVYVFDGKSWNGLGSEFSTAGVDGDWSLTGTAPTAANFIGTVNDEPLRFKVRSENAGLIGSPIISPFNTFLGWRSGNVNTGTENTGFGYEALRVNSTGTKNTAMGMDALYNNTTGTNNTAIGVNSLLANVSGSFNFAIGAFALSSATASNNTALGANSLLYHQTGDFNLGLGQNSLANNLIGTNNTAIGFSAGFNATGSNNVFIGSAAGFSEAGDNKLYIANNTTATPLVYGDFSAKYVTIGDVTPALRTQGTATGGYNLLVKGGILTEKVKVALAVAGTDWADYVFEPEYKAKMMKLEDIEKYTIANKHLPNVPSAEEMVKGGLDVSQTSKMFMEKIEELTLYMIEMNKEIKALKVENAKLKK
jgi:hypothetical protein